MKTKTKPSHTPLIIYGADYDGVKVCNDEREIATFHRIDCHDDEPEANARLFIAAPALLAALEPFTILNPLHCPSFAGSIEQARAAIAQATGKSSPTATQAPGKGII